MKDSQPVIPELVADRCPQDLYILRTDRLVGGNTLSAGADGVVP